MLTRSPGATTATATKAATTTAANPRSCWQETGNPTESQMDEECPHKGHVGPAFVQAQVGLQRSDDNGVQNLPRDKALQGGLTNACTTVSSVLLNLGTK